MKSVLVTGGCGYIGSHVAYELIREGYRAILLDRRVVPTLHHEQVHYVQCDLASTDLVAAVCARYRVSAVVHLAGSLVVHESVTEPYSYYYNNVVNTLGLLQVMRTQKIPVLINASSAAVYGNAAPGRLREDQAGGPTSPYGRTKYIVEQLLHDAARAYDLTSISLRLFNVAGGSPERGLHEAHVPETHLIPRTLHALTYGDPITVYGVSYPTPDGTAIRDYIHVQDVARACIAAIAYGQQRDGAHVYNIGSGHGSSVRQVIQACQASLSRVVPIQECPARAGDPAVLVADIQAAVQDLGWSPLCSQLDNIVTDAAVPYYRNGLYALQGQELVS